MSVGGNSIRTDRKNTTPVRNTQLVHLAPIKNTQVVHLTPIRNIHLVQVKV